jgi:hypothetical protein
MTRAGYMIKRDPLPPDPPPETPISITGDPEKQEHPDVVAQIAYESEHPIAVPERVVRPHPVVERTMGILRSRSEDSSGKLWTKGSPLMVRVSRKHLPRALRILDVLLKACEQRGYTAGVGESQDPQARVAVHGERLSFSLVEHIKRSDHVLSQHEQEERRSGRGWSIPRYDYALTGVLTFTIDGWSEGLQHRWLDRKNRPLESCLNEIIVALVRIAVTVVRPRRLKWQEEQLRWREAEKRRMEEQERLRLLNKSLEAWRANQELRSFLEALEKAVSERHGPVTQDSPVGRWLRWAHDLAERGDPMSSFVAEINRTAP